MTEEKFGKMVKVSAKIAIIGGTCVAVARYAAKKANEMERRNVGSSVKKYFAFMNGKNIKISNESVEDISISSFMGGVNIDLTEALITKDMDIHVKGVMSGINIKVPPMIRVILEGTNVMGGFANLVPNYESDALPTVFVSADNIMGGVAVQMIPTAEEK